MPLALRLVRLMEELIRATGALIFVLSIILGMGWVFRRYANQRANLTNQTSDLRIVEWRGMDSRRKLAVVHWDGREHLLCLSQTDQCVVASRDAPTPAEGDQQASITTQASVQTPPKLVAQVSQAISKVTSSIKPKEKS